MKPRPDIFSTYCRAVVKTYKFRRCAVYERNAHGQVVVRTCELRHDIPTRDLRWWPEVAYDKELVRPAAQLIELRDGVNLLQRAFDTGQPQEPESGALDASFLTPIFDEDEAITRDPVAVVEFYWRGNRRLRAKRILPHYDAGRLTMLARLLGRRLRAEKEEETSDALQSLNAGAYSLLTHLHSLKTDAKDLARELTVGGASKTAMHRVGTLTSAFEKAFELSKSVYYFQPKLASLKALVEKVFKQFKATISTPLAEGFKEPDLRDVEVEMDEGLMEECLKQPIQNSLRALIKVSAPRLWVHLRRRNGFAVLSFTDNGPGISGLSRSANSHGLDFMRYILDVHHGRMEGPISRNGRTQLRVFVPLKYQPNGEQPPARRRQA